MKNYAPENASFLLPFQFDKEKLVHDLSLILGGKWIPHFNTADYTGDWNVISLYAPKGEESNIHALSTSNSILSETPILQECNYFKEVIDFFKCPIQSARILKLGIGAEIKTHTDFNCGYEDGIFRIHIPIITNDDLHFVLNSKRLIMRPGETWYTNVNLPHYVANKGKTDRVHLVIDGERNEWSDEVFKSVGFDFNQEKEVVEQLSESTLLRMIEELEFHDLPQTKSLIEKYKNDLSTIKNG
jgi:hypothetical protein